MIELKSAMLYIQSVVSEVQQSHTSRSGSGPTLALIPASATSKSQENPYNTSTYNDFLHHSLPQIISSLHNVVQNEVCTTAQFQQELIDTGFQVGFFHTEVESQLRVLAFRLTNTLRRWLPIDEQLGVMVAGLDDDYIVPSRNAIPEQVQADLDQLTSVSDYFTTLIIPKNQQEKRLALLLNENTAFAKLSPNRKSVVSARLITNDSNLLSVHEEPLADIIREVNEHSFHAPGKIGPFSIEAIHQTLGIIARSMRDSLWHRCKRCFNY